MSALTSMRSDRQRSKKFIQQINELKDPTYDTDLGFEQLAVIEASESVSIDPANHSAHRFLSDTYVGIPRQEIARGSELAEATIHFKSLTSTWSMTSIPNWVSNGT